MSELGQHLVQLSGIVTATVAVACVAPRLMLDLILGRQLWSTDSLLLARHWGLLVGLLGILIVLAARQPALATPILLAAATEKLALVGLLLSRMRHRFRVIPALVAAGDFGFSLLYGAVLLGQV